MRDKNHQDLSSDKPDAWSLLESNEPPVMPVYPDLSSKRVLITGGASGIGAYFVAAFVAQGADVSFISLPSDDGAGLCKRVAKKLGKAPTFIPCDIRDVQHTQDQISELLVERGAVDILINNAARDTRHDLLSLSEAEWDDSLQTNLRPCFFVTQSVAVAMKEQRRGSIINVGSNSALLGIAGYPAYVAAKAAIHGLTRAFASELGEFGVRANTLVPGWVMTQRQKQLWVTPESLEECLRDQSLKSTISGVDIAQSALFLASDSASMVTGQQLIVDGGRV